MSERSAFRFNVDDNVGWPTNPDRREVGMMCDVLAPTSRVRRRASDFETDMPVYLINVGNTSGYEAYVTEDELEPWVDLSPTVEETLIDAIVEAGFVPNWHPLFADGADDGGEP